MRKPCAARAPVIAKRMAYLIAITGGSGSGKTTVARALAAALVARRCALIGEDDYYHCASAFPDFDADRHNFDAPAAKDHALLAAHLTEAKAGRRFAKPCYDLRTHRRAADSELVLPADFVIVEGLHVLCDDALRQIFDLRVFIDAEESLRLGRRMIRDVRDRARTPQSVLQQFFENVRPMHAAFVEPQRACADLLLVSTFEGGLAEADAHAAMIAARIRP